MRIRNLALLAVGAFTLACFGTTEEPAAEEPVVEEPEAAPKKPKKGRKSPGAPGTGAPEETPDEGEEDDGGDPEPAPSPQPIPPPPPGIEQVDATTWKVEEKLKDKWVADPGKFGNAKRKGKGYELGGLSEGSDGWYCGLRNGDVVKEVNGHSLETDAEAIAAYQELQNAKKLLVKMRRGEGPLTHTYLIVE